MLNEPPTGDLPEAALADRAAQDEEIDVLAVLRCDAPPVWKLLGEGQAAAAIAAGNAWLNSQCHPDAVVAVNVALSVAYLVAEQRLGAILYAEGALGAGLVKEHEELAAFLGVSLQSIGVSFRPGRVATLVSTTLCQLAEYDRVDAWLVRWATFQLRFARILLRNRCIAASIAAFDKLSVLKPELASGAAGHAIVEVLARADLHRTQAGVHVVRLEDELPPSVNPAAERCAALALDSRASGPLRLDAALAAADLDLALRSPAQRVADLVQVAERFAGTVTERVRALARRGALATRDPDPAERAAFLHAEERCSPCELRRECPRPGPALVRTMLHVAESALDLGELAMASRWWEAVSSSGEATEADLRIRLEAMHSDLALCLASRGMAAEPSVDETRARFEHIVTDFMAPGAVTPDRLDALGRVTYALVMLCLPHAPGEALIVLERARAVRLAAATAAGADATSALVDDAGLTSFQVPGRRLVVPRDGVGLVFLWDNRNGRLGVFTVMPGEDAPVVSYHWITCSTSTLDELIHAFEGMRRGSRPEPATLSLLRDEVLSAPAIAEALGDPLVRRVILVPHGPLAGLPLHAAAVGLYPHVTTFYAPLLSMPRSPRPAVSVRSSFCCLTGPMTDHDGDRIREESEACRGILAGARLTDVPGPADLESNGRANVPEVGLLHIAAHGAGVGDAAAPARQVPASQDHLSALGDHQRWRAARVDLADASSRRVRWTTRSILRAAPLRVDTVLLGCCEGARGINPSVTWLDRYPSTASWQVPFLDNPAHGITGALLAAGAGNVLAYPHHVLAECPLQFFPAILSRYADARMRGDVADPGDFDWATATSAVLRELAPRVPEDLQVELPLIQHWIAPETMAQRDNRDGGSL